MKSLCVVLLTFLLFASCSDSSTNTSNNSTASSNTESSAPVTTEEKTAYPQGKTIYQKTCIVCHMASGEGMTGTYPPLAKSDFLLADKNRAIHQVLKGSSATYTVNGNSYTGVMPPQGLTDDETAQVLNYVYHTWGNNGFTITASDVKAVRDTIKK